MKVVALTAIVVLLEWAVSFSSATNNRCSNSTICSTDTNSGLMNASPDMTRQLALPHIRRELIRQEETIIFSLIERSQFAKNDEVYVPGALTGSFSRSFLDYFLLETERLHARLRRYNSPYETAFFPKLLPAAILSPNDLPEVIKPNAVNVNDAIKSYYIRNIITKICVSGKDGEQGSAALADINVLQALSKRIHYGRFVAEAKFQANPRYEELVQKKDEQGLMDLLTDIAVEERLLKRVLLKASTYGQDIGDTPSPSSQDALHERRTNEFKVDPEVIVDIYRDFVMPMTKQVQVEYLLTRSATRRVAVLNDTQIPAAHSFFGQEKVLFVPTAGTHRVAAAVLSNQAHFGILPLENFTNGVNRSTAEALMEFPVNVCGEMFLEEIPCAVVRRVDSSEATSVSTTESLKCIENTRKVFITQPLTRYTWDSFYAEIFPQDVTIHILSSTEEASGALDADPDHSAALMLKSAAMTSKNLDILSPTLFDAKPMMSHYLVIGKTRPTATGDDRTLLHFQVDDTAGALLGLLQHFKNHEINATTIHSFQNHRTATNTDILLQVNGHVQAEPLKSALYDISKAHRVNVKGSFPSTR